MTRQELIDNDIRYAVCYGPVLIANGVVRKVSNENALF